MPDPHSGAKLRYYLSRCGEKQSNGRYGLDVVDIDKLPEGTLLEVKFNAMKANLYQMERVGTVPCWRWLGRSNGLPVLDSDNSNYWDYILDPSHYFTRDMVLAWARWLFLFVVLLLVMYVNPKTDIINNFPEYSIEQINDALESALEDEYIERVEQDSTTPLYRAIIYNE